MTLQELRRRVDRLAAARDSAAAAVKKLKKQAAQAAESSEHHQLALPIVIAIAKAYRRTRVERLEKPGTAALRAVFERDYGFQLVQQEKRGQLEVTPVVVNLDGHQERPTFSMGGGIADVVSLTLRPVLWSEQPKRSDAVMMLDEPASAINSADGIRNLSKVFQKLSRALGLQYVIVTNRPALAESADQIINLTNPDGFNTQVEIISAGKSVSSHGQA